MKHISRPCHACSASSTLLRLLYPPLQARPQARLSAQPNTTIRTTILTSPPPRRPFSLTHQPHARTTDSHDRFRQPIDDPNWVSLLDAPPILQRVTKQRHGWGVLILAFIPITAFVLGTWQVYRLDWKSKLLAQCEDRLVREPLPLPPQVDASAVAAGGFDYRRVYATGILRHDLEMLIGPRMRDGEDGYMVVTPLERSADHDGSMVLVNRGWIPKAMKKQAKREDGLPRGVVTVEGLLRTPWKKNMFTPENKPEKGEFYFPDVRQMAEITGSQPVWIEATMDPDLRESMDFKMRGIPLGRRAEVSLSNNHAQYIFTWYSLTAATTIMLWLVMKKKPTDLTRRVRMSRSL